jgi:Possible hemagglutinin (DUF637)/Pre-toxin domain with VENN motif/Contact-dependent growth inhibition CdiA C-terminal domain
MNNVVSTSPSSYRYSPATSGILRRSKFVARSHVLTNTAKASRVCMSSLTHVNAARPDKHLQASQAAKPIQQAIPAVKQPIYKQNQPVVQVSTAQAATKFIVSIASTTPTQLKDLAAKPGMNWVNDVAAQSAELAKTNPGAALHIQNVQLAHDQWDYKQQGLTKEGAAIVTLVVAYFTAGAASGAGSALAGGAGMTTTTVTAAGVATTTLSTAGAMLAGATTAALSSLAAQASVSFINNGGNLGAVLNELGSKESIKGLAMAMVTAGALNGLSSAMGGVTATGGTQWSSINATSPFVDQLQKNLVNQLTSNVLQTALTGGNRSDYEKSLQTSLLTAFISTGAAQGANAIGDMQANGSLNALTHKLAHAIAGCAAGAATASVGGGSAGNGCGSGAIGAVIGELTAQTVGGNMKPEDAINLSRLMAGVAGALTGGDVTLAANAGGNAVENNYLNHTQATMRAALEDKKRRQALTATEQQQLDGLNVLDIAKDLALKDACKTAGDACDAARRDLNASIASYTTSTANGTNPRLSATGNASVTGERDQNLQLANDPKLANQSLTDGWLEFAPGQIAGYVIGGALGLYLQEARAIYAAIKAETAAVAGPAAGAVAGSTSIASTPGKVIGSTEGLTAAEQSFIGEMVGGGKTVQVIPATNTGRSADFFINGVKYELKTMSSVVDTTSNGLSGAISSTAMNARSQSGNIIIDARNQGGMTVGIAERGVIRAFGADKDAAIQSITIITKEGTVYVPRKPTSTTPTEGKP